MNPRFLTIALLLGSGLLFTAGCNTTKTTQTDQPREKYETTQTLGSRIPVKKKKKEALTEAEKASYDTLKVHQEIKSDARFPTGGGE
ncbi:MAG: hypothetical protein KBC32_04520 [Candidatus Didemnitutus sp.]|nr:hypothetical protein [Candidatus Didemnitutus sp.]